MIVAYTALHYGADTLRYAIASVIDQVDQYHVLYARQGSHGHRTNDICPDTRHALYREALGGAGEKLFWHDGEWTHEGLQRDSIYQYVPDAEVILVLDADEIWAPGAALDAISQARRGTVRNYRVPIIHYWRSFYKAVLHDPAYPTRVIVPGRRVSGDDTLSSVRPINHLGYAQRSAIVRYKLGTHGHHDEFRRDCDWFNQVFMANRQYDCHPVGSEYWNPETVEPLDYMPAWMRVHPYYDMEVIP